MSQAIYASASTVAAQMHTHSIADVTSETPYSPDITSQLLNLAKVLDKSTFKFVILLPQFDKEKLWLKDGHKSCIAWLNAACGMSPSAAGDRRRVGYALEELPVIRQLFEIGELSWSKVRALTRFATADNERLLASNALHQTASDIERLASRYRHVNTLSEIYAEDARAVAQYQNRRVNYRFDESGMVRIHALLPPVEGAAVLKSIEHAEDLLFTDANGTDANGTDANNKFEQHAIPNMSANPHIPAEQRNEDAAQTTASQRRADALCLLAMKYMNAGRDSSDIRTADRFQVVIHVDAAVLGQTVENSDLATTTNRATGSICHIEGGPKIAASTARRIADDCSVVPLFMKHGEPLSIGRKSRVWPASVSRAIMARDCQCQFPGCSAQRHLHFHHLTHWADGGETSVEGGVALCGFHHRLVHEQRYKVVKTTLDQNGQLPNRTVEVVTSNGDVLQLSSPMKRFQVKRPDGSWVT